MHYYQHHIGDFARDTANLDDHQLATYMRMLWAYYGDETPLHDDCERIAFAVRSNEKTVRLLLQHYFTLTPEGWRHSRCDREIQEYRAKADKARNSANARWKNANALPPQSERNSNEHVFDANQEPITKNQEKAKNTVAKAPVVQKPEDVSQSTWDDFQRHRKTKKANITETALSGIRREAVSAGWGMDEALAECCVRGWTGFKADWVQRRGQAQAAAQSQPGGGRREL